MKPLHNQPPAKTSGYEVGDYLGVAKYAAHQYDVYLSKCEDAIIYTANGRGWHTEVLRYLGRNANSFCRDCWRMVDAHNDPSVSPKCKAG